MTSDSPAVDVILRTEGLGRSVPEKVLVADASFAVQAGLTSLVSTLMIRAQVMSPADQLLLRTGQ